MNTDEVQMPARTPVESKLLTGIAYHPESQTLEVEFSKSGAVYRYHGIDQSAHDAMLAAPSIGSHFLKHIKTPDAKFTRVK